MLLKTKVNERHLARLCIATRRDLLEEKIKSPLLPVGGEAVVNDADLLEEKAKSPLLPAQELDVSFFYSF